MADALGVRHPLDEATILGQRQHCKGGQLQATPSTGLVAVQQHIEQACKLHHAQVLAQIVLGLGQKGPVAAVGALERHLLGRLQARHDVHAVKHALDARRVKQEGRVPRGGGVPTTWPSLVRTGWPPYGDAPGGSVSTGELSAGTTGLAPGKMQRA